MTMLIKSYLPRAACVIILLQVPIWLISDALAPSTSTIAYDSTFKKVAEELAGNSTHTKKQFADLSHRYNLSWLHLTDKSKQVAVSTRPNGVAETEASGQASRVVNSNGGRFVELSKSFGGDEILAIGFRCPSLTDALFGKQIWPAQVALGTVSTALLLNAAALLASYLFFLGLPLQKALKNLSSGQDVPDNFPVYVSSELESISQGIKHRFASLKEDHEKSITAARSDLSGVFAKEVEDRFTYNLGKDIVTLQNSNEVSELILQRLADQFAVVAKAGFAVEYRVDGSLNILSQSGLSEEQQKQINGLPGSRFAIFVQKISAAGFLKPDELADKRIEQVAGELSCDQVLVAPISLDSSRTAYLCIFTSGKDRTSAQKLERMIRNMSEYIRPLWHLIAKYEEAYWLSRFDYMTGAKNKVFLEETLIELQHKAANQDRVFMVFEGDNFRVMLGSYGPRTIDRLIKELSQELLSALDNSVRFKKASMRVRFTDFFYRIGACRFLLVLEDINLKKSVEMAESVIQTVSERKDWAHGMPSWSVSCGIAVLDNGTPADNLEEALLTLDFIRSKKASGVVVVSKDVPDEFMSRALQKNAAGDSSIFNPVVLLNDFTASEKTGILTVSSGRGRVFWAYIENGKPTKARMGKLCGDAAVLEFVCDFEDGTTRLQDLSTLDKQSAEDLKTLAGAYLLTMPLSELLDFASKVKDSANAARVHLKTPDMIVHPTVDKQAGQIEKAFHEAGKTANKLYLDVAGSVWELCNGRLTLDEIIARTQETLPLALIWAAADFLFQAKMIKFSRLRVSTLTDGSVDQQAALQARTNSAPVAEAAALSGPPASAGGSSSRIPAATSGAGPAPAQASAAGVKSCVACGQVDPLSGKYCIHCGAEMVIISSAD